MGWAVLSPFTGEKRSGSAPSHSWSPARPGGSQSIVWALTQEAGVPSQPSPMRQCDLQHVLTPPSAGLFNCQWVTPACTQPWKLTGDSLGSCVARLSTGPGPHMGSTVTMLFVMQLTQDDPAAKWQSKGMPQAALASSGTLPPLRLTSSSQRAQRGAP